jgi:peroxiredoxin
MPVNASNCNFGWKAIDFKLRSINDKIYSLNELKGENGTVIVFICNHCPYVKSIGKRLSNEANELSVIGINTIAIMSNDVSNYPEDSFENMKIFAEFYKFNFKYLYDENQTVAKNYNALCTPDFFGFNKFLELQYRGRIDSGINKNNTIDIKRELFEGMKLICETNKGPINQVASIGCSIKWKK